MRQAKASCAEVPQFDRLTYFYGQMLHARDLQAEQSYFREKLKLHNRCLHGWGVVCGLEVTPPPVRPGLPAGHGRRVRPPQGRDRQEGEGARAGQGRRGAAAAAG